MINELILFLTLFVPNVMRQLVYLKSYKKSKSFDFCVSDETRWMNKKGFLPWMGIIEEIGWGILWTIFWLNGTQWLAFGWISDSLLDCSMAYAIARKRKIKGLTYGAKGAYVLREVLLPYVITGPILYLLGLNVLVYSIITTIIGVILWLKI